MVNENRWDAMKSISAVAIPLVGLLAGFVIGALEGMDLFGNYFVNARFFGNRGYEAGFWYGGITGGVAGLLLGLFLLRVIRRWQGGRQQR